MQFQQFLWVPTKSRLKDCIIKKLDQRTILEVPKKYQNLKDLNLLINLILINRLK